MTATLHTLLLACQDGDEDKVDRILESGEVGVNAADESGITAAQVASANDQLGILQLLVKFHANINQTNNVGWTPLLQACWHGHTNTAQYLIQQGVDVNKRNKYGASALTIAASSGHLSVVRLLLEAGLKADEGGVEDRSTGSALPSPAETRTCPTPVISAALYGREGVLRSLLNRSAKPDVLAAPARWTPLMFAAVGGSKPCCQLLLERSADPNKVNLLGATALDIASGSGNTDVRVYLETKTLQNKRLSRTPQQETLLQAVREGNVERVKELLSKEDTNVDMQDDEGATPLILAAIGGHFTITQLLIGLGANLNHQDKVTGWTALMQATFFSHIDIVELLLQSDADVSLTAQNGCTALDLATLVDDKDSALVRLLAAYTIQKVPPSLVLTPSRRPLEPRLAFQTRSFSETQLNLLQPVGFKSIWSKLANSFKRSPSVASNADVDPSEQDGLQEFVPQTSVFTLGFTNSLASNNTSTPALPFSSPPNFRHFLHDTSCSPSKFQMPPGRSPTNMYPKSIRLVSITENQSPVRSISSEIVNSISSANAATHSVSSANAAHKPERGRKKTRRKRSHKSSVDENTPTTVLSVLKRLGLEELYPLFVQEEVDMQALRGVNNEDLASIGIHSPLDRDKIINYVKSH